MENLNDTFSTTNTARQRKTAVAAAAVDPVDENVLINTLPRMMMTQTGRDIIFQQDGDELISKSLDKIGFGSYQKRLFWLCSFAWFNDAFWFTGISFILPQFQQVFGVNATEAGLILTLFYAGCCIGELFWGFVATVYGRVMSFTVTMAACGTLGLIMGLMPNFPLIAILAFFVGTAYGGNMGLSTVLFLESTPKEQGSMISFMMVMFNIGAMIAGALSWGIIPLSINFAPSGPYSDASWRVYLIVMGLITIFMLIIRKIALPVKETPYFLLSKGDRQGASKVLRFMAEYNGQPIPDSYRFPFERNVEDQQADVIQHTTIWEVAKEHLTEGSRYLKELWEYTATDPKLRTTTILLFLYWFVLYWGYIGFAGLVSLYVSNLNLGSDSDTYRDLFIYSAAALPTSWLAAYMLDSRLGRVGTMWVSALVLGISTLCWGIVAVVAGLQGSSANTAALSAGSIVCLIVFNATLTVVMVSMWLYTPEVYPAKYRTVMMGFAMALGRLSSLIVPLVSGAMLDIDSPISNAIPSLVNGVITIISAGIAFFLPIETLTKKDQNQPSSAQMFMKAMNPASSPVQQEWMETGLTSQAPVS